MISIIIPMWGQHEMTAECLLAIRETTQDYELILVDNGSDPPYAKPYMGFVDVTLIRNEENKGFPVAANQGVRASKGETVILLNNDVIVTPFWAERLEKHLTRFSIVGPLTNYSMGRQRVTIPVYEDKQSLYQAAFDYTENRIGVATEANWVIGFCYAFRRALYDEIGEFDESIWPSSGEEIDFCYRAKAKGHLVGIARDVYVHHEGSQTFLDMQNKGIIGYEDICDKSTEHLKKKWGENFWKEQIVRGVTSVNGLRLNLGCGKFPLSGFVNVDMDEEVKPDMICDILDLPYEEDSVDEIYAGHILEHFDWKEGEEALQYWFHLLKPGAKISVTVPDFDVLAKEYILNPTAGRLREFNDLYIYSYRQKSPHRYAYNAALLEEVMIAAGFAELNRMPSDHHYFPHPVNWQVGMEAVKPCE